MSDQRLDEECNMNRDLHFGDAVTQGINVSNDYVAKIILEYLGSTIICSDIKNNVIWICNDDTKLWQENGYAVLINYIMKHGVRPVNEDLNLIRHGVHNISNNIGYSDDERRSRSLIIDQLENMETRLFKLRDKLRTRSYCKLVIESIKEISFDPAFTDKLDTNKYILPLLNNMVLDLTTCEVRTRSREDYCTFTCPVNYDPEARSDIVDKFLDDITLNNNDLKTFLQRIFGLCLTGDTHRRQMYILYGLGDNGKTAIINLMRKLLGRFCVATPEAVFLCESGCKNTKLSPYMSKLGKCRMSVTEEFGGKKEINIPQLKAYADNYITCNGPFNTTVEFIPHFKPFLVTNLEPVCNNNRVLHDQLVIVPFNCVFVDRTTNLLPYERVGDFRIVEKILEDPVAMSAFLNWLVIGANWMCMSGELPVPDIVAQATRAYISKHDIYLSFVEDMLSHDTSEQLGWKIHTREVFSYFRDWCGEKSIETPSFKDFMLSICKILGLPDPHDGGVYFDHYAYIGLIPNMY